MVTGWGNLFYKGPQAEILQEVGVKTITNEKCREKFGNRRIKETMICAGRDGKDSCRGDSGGPLAHIRQGGSYTQIGVVSWGRPCGVYPEYAGVYTRLTAFLGWLKTTITSPVKIRGRKYLNK